MPSSQTSPSTSPHRRTQRTRKPSDAQTTVDERQGICAENPPKLLFWHEIPSWQQDNECILSGYRPTSASIYVSFASLSYLNNQTVNSYSHLFGCALFAILPLYFKKIFFDHQPNACFADLVVVSVYCFGVSICFTFSAIFHILWNHSPNCYRLFNKLDYLGILILMWGAGIPTIYYGFLCDHKIQLVYWVMTTTTALGCTYMTLSPRFASPQFRHWRAAFYARFGLSSIIFVIHGLLLYGWELQRTRMSLKFMGWMGVTNLLGAAVYTARIPERWVRYKFDMFGASHQILHVAVMVAAWIHFEGLVAAFRDTHALPVACG
ncbi:unnamed protein product [Cercospora beticola]|nr:unnamed protein product [Cercospora beticola]